MVTNSQGNLQNALSVTSEEPLRLWSYEKKEKGKERGQEGGKEGGKFFKVWETLLHIKNYNLLNTYSK